MLWSLGITNCAFAILADDVLSWLSILADGRLESDASNANARVNPEMRRQREPKVWEPLLPHHLSRAGPYPLSLETFESHSNGP